MNTNDSSLIYNNSAEELFLDAQNNKNVTITQNSSSITVVANNSRDKTPGIFFGNTRENGINIPILQNVLTTIVVTGYCSSGSAFIYAGHNHKYFVPRSNLLLSTSSTITVNFKITDPLVTEINVGILFSGAKKDDQFVISSFKLYQELPIINTPYLSAVNAYFSNWTGGGTTGGIVTTTDLSSVSSGSVVIIEDSTTNSTSTIILPTTSVQNGTTYKLLYTTSTNNVNLVLLAGSNSIIGQYFNSVVETVPSSNIIGINFNASVADNFNLIFYNTVWYITAFVADDTIPTISTTCVPIVENGALTPNSFAPHLDILQGTITNAWGADLTSVGFCINLASNSSLPTTSDTTIVRSILPNATSFSFDSPITTPFFSTNLDTDLYGRRYVVSSYGVGYSPVVTFQVTQCLLKGTNITLADGSNKLIENIDYNDELLVWDFDNGCFSLAKPLWIKKEELCRIHNKLVFSDGSILKTITQHRIFNKEKGMFTYPMSDDTPIGTTTFNKYGNEVKLVSKDVVTENNTHFNVITDYHINLFAENILTSCRYNNIYPIVNMRFQFPPTPKTRTQSKLLWKEDYGIPKKYYDGLRIAEQQIQLSDSKQYIDRLIARSS